MRDVGDQDVSPDVEYRRLLEEQQRMRNDDLRYQIAAERKLRSIPVIGTLIRFASVFPAAVMIVVFVILVGLGGYVLISDVLAR